MGDKDDGRVGLALGHGQEVQDLGLDGHIQGGGGLIGDDHVRIVGDGDGDHDPLAHAAGEFMGEGDHPFFLVIDAHHFQQFHAPVMHGFLAHIRVVDEQGLGQLVANGEHGAQGAQGVLKDHGDAFAPDAGHLFIGLTHQLLTVQGDGSADGGVVVQKPDEGQGGDGLSGAGFAHDAQGAAPPQVEVHASDGLDVAGFGGEGDVQVPHLHDRVALGGAFGAVGLEVFVSQGVVFDQFRLTEAVLVFGGLGLVRRPAFVRMCHCCVFP